MNRTVPVGIFNPAHHPNKKKKIKKEIHIPITPLPPRRRQRQRIPEPPSPCGGARVSSPSSSSSSASSPSRLVPLPLAPYCPLQRRNVRFIDDLLALLGLLPYSSFLPLLFRRSLSMCPSPDRRCPSGSSPVTKGEDHRHRSFIPAPLQVLTLVFSRDFGLAVSTNVPRTALGVPIHRLFI